MSESDPAGVSSGDNGALLERLTKRRPRGGGSLRMRQEGRWEARVVLGHHNGRQIRRSFYGRSALEAEVKAHALARSLRQSIPKAVRSGVTPGVRFKVLKRCGFACTYCGRRPPEVALQIDHLLPVALGGKDDEDNLTAACVDCNVGKGSTA